MAIFTLKSTAVLRSTFYLKDGGPAAASGTLYPPLRLLLLDSASVADVGDSETTAILSNESTRVDMRT